MLVERDASLNTFKNKPQEQNEADKSLSRDFLRRFSQTSNNDVSQN